MAEDSPHFQLAGDEEGETVDDTVPLTPSPRPNSSISDTPAGTDNLDEVDPFTYKPPFTLCDKIIVSQYFKTVSTF